MSVGAILYGIGVGPGDPELMTLKGARLVAETPVIAYPAPNGGESLARSIAAGFISEDATELAIDLPMNVAREPAQAAYAKAAELIAGHLAEGRSVAFLCEGDPLFYGSFMYLLGLLADDRHRVEIVPGITSLTACAAVLGKPLAARNEVLKVLPAPLSAERLRGELETTDAAAIVKVGRHFDKVRQVLRDLALSDSATIVEAATRSDERITPLEDIPEGERPYFSTILIYKGQEGW